MKKILILFLPVFLIFSCQNAENTSNSDTPIEVKEVAPTPVKIIGEITNPAADEVSIRATSLNLKAPVTDGKFELNFDLTKPTYLTFRHGRESGGLYLEPGDEVTLTLNPEQFDETLKLEGKGSEESNFLLAKYLLNESYQKKMKETYSLPLAEFAQKVDEIKKANLDHLDSFKKMVTDINPHFLKNEKSSIEYEWATSKLNYPSYFEYFTKSDKPELGPDYYSFMDKINLNDEYAYDNNQNYARMIESYMNIQGESAGEGINNLSAVFEATENKIKSEKIKTKVLFGNLVNYLKNNDAAGTDKFVEKFNAINKDEQLKTKVTDTYNNAMRLLKGKPAPTFTYADTKGKTVSLESLKGKNVYVDVWATWCGPCKVEIPHLKELEAQYHNSDDIVFMSVSIDKEKDKQKWLDMVEEKELTGLQLMADKDWKSSICQDYSIWGIPRFILIDKEGNILDKNAPRPSSTEIKEVFASLAGPGVTSMK